MPALEDPPKPGEYLYKIGALAREFSTTARTLRFYEQQGLLWSNKAISGRRYSEAGRSRLRLILRLKKMGFSIREIRAVIQEQRRSGAELSGLGAEMCSNKIEELEGRIAQIDAAIADLRQRLEAL